LRPDCGIFWGMTQQRSDKWFKQALRQAPWRTQTQATSLVLAVVIMVLVIGALYLAQASRTAAAGRRLQDLEAQRKALEQQNAQLRAEIAALQSVPRLTEQAEALGYHFAHNEDVEYIELADLPPRRSAVSQPEPEPEEGDQVVPYEESLGGWLARQAAAFKVESADFFERTFGTPGAEENQPAEETEIPLLPGIELPTEVPEATPDA
jgi:cell division protein FtsL